MTDLRHIVFLACVLLFLPVPVFAACGSTNQASMPAQVVDAQFAAYNAHDLNSFASCYADDVTMIDLSGKRPVIKGNIELRKAFSYLANPPNGRGVQIVRRIVNGPMVIDQERPVGMTGKPDLIAIYEVRNGKIINVWFPPAS
jgi:hypothetical protein